MRDLRNLPEMLKAGKSWEERRKEIRELFADGMYGRMMLEGYQTAVSGEDAIQQKIDGISCFYQRVLITVKGLYGTHSYPVRIWVPDKGRKKYPFVLYLTSSMSGEGSEHQLGEEWMPPVSLLENGIGAAVCLAEDIEKDKPESFPGGLAYAVAGEGSDNSMGCLCTWGVGLKLAADVLAQCSFADSRHIAAAGCSRYGKAVLWYSANDERIEVTASFDSGCGGAAVNRGKKDERITGMMHNFPHWLCRNAKRFSDREEEMPFDQHMLLGLIAPRRLLVTSATLDPYCDPYSEFLGTVYSGEAYEQYGFEGIGTCIWPPAGKLLRGEGAAYYLRTGSHGVEKEDWEALITFWKAESLEQE